MKRMVSPLGVTFGSALVQQSRSPLQTPLVTRAEKGKLTPPDLAEALGDAKV